MRIFLAGDSYSGTGPANVTKYYIENMPPDTLYQKQRGKLARVPEIFINTLRADLVLYSGYSKQNILGMKLARLLGRKTAYLMHGCVEYENEINREVDENMCAVERKTLELSDLIIAVSRPFSEWLKEYYREYSDKITYVTNGIDEDTYKDNMGEGSAYGDRDRHMIFTIGGGMPRKKIKHICEAVQILRSEYDKDMKLLVVGALGSDSQLIDSYPFVEDRGIVNHKQTMEYYRRAGLFVQNSCFETFGLAPVEAISVSCPTLCSRQVGALDIIEDVRDMDIIDNYDDPIEISKKIKNLIENPNGCYLNEKIKWELCSWNSRSLELIDKLSQLVQ